MKKISVAVCVCDNGGVTFLGKRQSRDRVLIADFIRSAEGKPVCISSFSKTLFADYPEVAILPGVLDGAPDGSVCFVENEPLSAHIDEISTLTVYKWNRIYPYDKKLDVNPEREGFRLSSVSEFEGSSHEKITKEIWRK